MPLPFPCKARDLEIELTPGSIAVGRKRDPAGPWLSGAFTHAVKTGECVWTLEEGGGTVVVQLVKQNGQQWWKSVLVGDAEIDLSKVVPENSKLGDLDRETRQTVEKMMYDQRRKQMGLPTSEDEKKNEMLQKFMEQHPEMDFSKAKFS